MTKFGPLSRKLKSLGVGLGKSYWDIQVYVGTYNRTGMGVTWRHGEFRI